MAVIEWPADLMKISDATFFIQPQNRSAGRGLSGSEQILDGGVAWWTIALTFALDFDRDSLKRFEAQVSMMRGRANSALLPICEPFRYGASVSPLQIPHGDGTWHSDSTGAMTGDGVHPSTVGVGASAGASEITMTLTNPRRPSFRVGDLFSHSGWLHRVVRRNEAGWTRIEPPLRAGLPAGTVLETAPPVWRCKFATDDEGRRIRENLRWGAPVTLNFVECFDR